MDRRAAGCRRPTTLPGAPSGWTTDFSRHAVALSEFQDGGPGRDGIPPIDRPGLVGELAAATLEPVDAQVLSWSQFKAAHPDGSVLARPEPSNRPSGTNPYVGYDAAPSSQPTFYDGRIDPRFEPLERVAAVFAGNQTAVVAVFLLLGYVGLFH